MEQRGLKAAIERMVTRLVGVRLDVLAAYPARVVSQHSDGTIDVVPDSATIPSLTNVPIRYGVPGISAKVNTGSRVMIEFAEGDARYPMATIWEGQSLKELIVTATGNVTISTPGVANVSAGEVRLADGDRQIARAGDPVTVILTAATAAQFVTPPTPPPSAWAISGYILSGSSRVKSS